MAGITVVVVLRMSDRGQAGIGVLFSTLILALLLFGAIELGQGYALKHALDSGTAAGARMLSIYPAGWTEAVQTVQDAVDTAILGGGGTVSCRTLDAAGRLTDPAALAFGERFTLECSVPFQAHVPFMNLSGRTITSAHSEIIEQFP